MRASTTVASPSRISSANGMTSWEEQIDHEQRPGERQQVWEAQRIDPAQQTFAAPIP
jgi:hypothetical protein